MSTPVTILPGTLPPGACYPDDPQLLNVEIVSRITAFVDTAFAGVYASPTPPPADQRDKIWFNTTVQRLYYWVNGGWWRTYSPPAGGGELRMLSVTADTYNAQEGGDATSVGVGDYVGPLWVAAPEFDGRVPVGTGTFPGTSPAVSVALGANVGSDNGAGSYLHTLTVDELPPHHHALQIFDGPVQGGVHPQSYIGTTSQGTFNTDDTGGGMAFNNMPPFRGVTFVKRSGRIYVASPY